MRNNGKVQTLLIILVLALGLGYAYINSDLNINGTAQVNSANWDVHWANVQVTTGSVSASSPTISNQTTVNYSVVLNTPGDYYEFTVDAVNGGTIDAMIDSIDSKLNGATITTLPDYLKYTVTYSDGIELEPNHQLLHNTTEKYKVRIEYNDDIELNQIPATNQTLSLQFTVIYRQATDDATERSRIVYTANKWDFNNHIDLIQFDEPISSDITQYNSGQEALAAMRAEFDDDSLIVYLRHLISEGVVKESYLEFVITPEMANEYPGLTVGTYAIRGVNLYDSSYNCKSEYYDSSTGHCDSPYYESNKNLLLSVFGSERCNDGDIYIVCSLSDYAVTISTHLTGRTSAKINSNWHIKVDYEGSGCVNGPYY